MFKHGKRFPDGSLMVLSRSGDWVNLRVAAEKYNKK